MFTHFGGFLSLDNMDQCTNLGNQLVQSILKMQVASTCFSAHRKSTIPYMQDVMELNCPSTRFRVHTILIALKNYIVGDEKKKNRSDG